MRAGRIRAGLNYAQHRYRHGSLELRHGQGRGGIAGDDQVLSTMLYEKAGALDGITGDRGLRFGAVGQAGGIAKIKIARATPESKTPMVVMAAEPAL